MEANKHVRQINLSSLYKKLLQKKYLRGQSNTETV